MKNIKYVLLLSALLSVGACNFLDFDESTGNDKEYMFTYMDEVGKMVTFVYSFLPDDYNSIGNAMRESASDNAVHVWSNNAIYGFYDGSWSVTHPIDNVWARYYEAIRCANNFLRDFDISIFDRYQHDLGFEDDIKKMELYPYQVRFLRAFYYFELIKRYRNVPLVLEPLEKEEVNHVQQSSFEDIARFIVKECEACAEKLPGNWKKELPGGTADLGRITKGACMALKSRVLLYVASPLINETGDVKKYQAAASAADSLIAMELYKITPNSVLWGNGNDVLASEELILERRNGDSNDFEFQNTAKGFEGGSTGACPTQNLVDAYPMKDGSAFDWNNPAHVSDPYANRDPRFAEAVLYNGAKWKENVVESFEGGKNGQPIYGATLTGYYLKKHMNEGIVLKQGNTTQRPHHFPLFRYAEVLLNYAEAQNEVAGPDAKGDFQMTPVEAINMVRTRSGAKALAAGLTQEQFREICRNERRIELSFEDHRFWDIRRWKIGPETSKIYGMKITKDGSGFKYEKVLVQDREWNDRMYFYPIPQGEILKNTNLKQNPGW